MLGKKIRKMFNLTELDIEKIRKKAEERGASHSQILRDLIRGKL